MLSVSILKSNKFNSSDCPHAHWVNDGICDEYTNTFECNFDGGDCIEQITTTTISNKNENQSIGTPINSYYSNCSEPSWVGDGYCDDQTNNKDCQFDGGDCCLDFVQKDYCSFCICHELESETTTPNIFLSTTTKTSCQLNFADEIGNGICNDYINTPLCNYDGGDCCLPEKGNLCIECRCFQPETTTSTISLTTTLHEWCISYWSSSIGNGVCSDFLNIEICNFDGGDCKGCYGLSCSGIG